jgi:energy-coupling factor transporter ATP-binding protein EcfA2
VFAPLTVIVGQNNAGKSTIIEALRLASLVTTRYKSLNYRGAPQWAELSSQFRGVQPSLRGFEFNLQGAFYQYSDPPAELDILFRNGGRIRVFIGPEFEIFALIASNNGKLINSRTQATRADLPEIRILPQVRPLTLNETLLASDYVRSAADTPLAPSHFRNQLRAFSEYFEDFKNLAEETWHGLSIRELDSGRGYPGDPITLQVRCDAFVGEVGWMGHGLQMWLQTMWFLARSRDAETVILDEPDVYMHPDLQRRLIRLLVGQHKQTIVATHSVEIMAEVEPGNILVLDRRRHESQFAKSLPAVQRIIDGIGGVHNLQLARLWSGRKMLLVEGDDLKILKRLHAILFPSAKEGLDQIPNMSINGWAGWPYAIGSSMLMRNALDEQIVSYCILDSDYHPEEEVKKRYAEARQRHVQLHIWQKKEMENYLIVPEVIHRAINKQMQGRKIRVGLLATELDRIAESLKQDVMEALVTEYLAINRAGGASIAMRRAKIRLDACWGTLDGKLAAVSGKDILSRLFEWCAATLGAHLSVSAIISAMIAEDLAPEVRQVLADIEGGTPFAPS